jgi:dihydroneopterin aldolase
MPSDLTIHITGLKRMASVGILDHERQRPQTLIIDAEFKIDPALVLSSPSIDHTIDYEMVANQITEFLKDQDHIDLLETLADRIIDLFWDQTPVRRITIRLQKPGIIDDCDMTSVELTRHR